ncbi:hypothetical protein M5K25_011174 [Dendrobium thyrsiflorum]|uniref:Uncharacterized protein n=1 Tax=Dendrobium thyrsiflorum TaxID=117978 RepID=A0ABD0V958_DENTH
MWLVVWEEEVVGENRWFGWEKGEEASGLGGGKVGGGQFGGKEEAGGLLIAKDCGPPGKQIMPPLTFKYGAEWNGKQLQTDLPAGEQTYNTRKIAKITADGEPRRNLTSEMTTNSRKEFHPEILSGNIFAAATTGKLSTRTGESGGLISKASVAEWTDEQLEKLFSDYEDDLDLVRPAI